jgi:hypothetical protein
VVVVALDDGGWRAAQPSHFGFPFTIIGHRTRPISNAAVLIHIHMTMSNPSFAPTNLFAGGGSRDSSSSSSASSSTAAASSFVPPLGLRQRHNAATTSTSTSTDENANPNNTRGNVNHISTKFSLSSSSSSSNNNNKIPAPPPRISLATSSGKFHPRRSTTTNTTTNTAVAKNAMENNRQGAAVPIAEVENTTTMKKNEVEDLSRWIIGYGK